MSSAVSTSIRVASRATTRKSAHGCARVVLNQIRRFGRHWPCGLMRHGLSRTRSMQCEPKAPITRFNMRYRPGPPPNPWHCLYFRPEPHGPRGPVTREQRESRPDTIPQQQASLQPHSGERPPLRARRATPVRPVRPAHGRNLEPRPRLLPVPGGDLVAPPGDGATQRCGHSNIGTERNTTCESRASA
jgi:hypothetical protein